MLPNIDLSNVTLPLSLPLRVILVTPCVERQQVSREEWVVKENIILEIGRRGGQHSSSMESSRGIIQKSPVYYQIKTPSLSVLFNEPALERQQQLLFCPVCLQPYQIAASPSDHHYNWNTTPQAGQAGPLSAGELERPPKPLLTAHMENLYNRNFAASNDGGTLYFCFEW